MKIFSVLLLVCVFTSISMAQVAKNAGPQQHISVDLPEKLDRVLRDYEKGWREEDPIFLASLFSEDGFIMRPRHAPIRGREAIAEAYSNSGGPLTLRALDYSESGSIAYIIGAFQTAEEGQDVGKFILTLVLVDDRWLISADMDNSNS